ncbi:hypothetical protein HMPREF3192_00835 [Atopobium deltae]|uniref:Uncharacterized protein n=1 Tax=Atopobium deltae TaxID=1393034 RepID=A0A133XTZ5_9ACTN|nr:hypothetical protein HMPREF3192_00835 [Atopobium deltae]
MQVSFCAETVRDKFQQCDCRERAASTLANVSFRRFQQFFAGEQKSFRQF